MLRILTLPGVFSPPSDCRLLAGLIEESGLARGARVLDVFTGSGALAVVAARAGARDVTAIDISRRAVVTVRANAWLNRVRVRALRGDLLAPVAGERFDLIVANPPYLPGQDDTLPARGPARAWEGGRDGRRLVERLCAAAPDHLEADGTLLIVHSSLTGEQATLDSLREAGLRAEVLSRVPGPLGPIAAARAPMFEERGLLAPGERWEDMLVLQGSRDESSRSA